LNRRIVLVNFDFPPIQGPGVWRTLGFAAHLPKLGWGVSVIASDRPTWHSRIDPSLLGRIPAGVRVHRVRGRAAGSILQRVMPARVVRAWRDVLPSPVAIPALKMVALALAHAPRKPFAILTSGPPHVSHLVGLVLKRTHACTWIADFRDLWMDDPEQAWAGWYQTRLGLETELAVLHGADTVVTVSPTWAEALRRKGGKAPVHLIRNAADATADALPPAERPWPVTERVVLFAGTPQPNNTAWRFQGSGPDGKEDDLWEGIRRYLHSTTGGQAPVRFAFLGLNPAIHDRLARFGIAASVDDLGPQRHERALALLQGADAALVPQRTSGSEVSRGTIPAKIYQAMAAGKHIILLADPEGDAARMLAGYPHTLAAGNDPAAIAEAFRRFAEQAPASHESAIPPEFVAWSRHAATVELDRLIRELNPAFEPESPPARRQ